MDGIWNGSSNVYDYLNWPLSPLPPFMFQMTVLTMTVPIVLMSRVRRNAGAGGVQRERIQSESERQRSKPCTFFVPLCQFQAAVYRLIAFAGLAQADFLPPSSSDARSHLASSRVKTASFSMHILYSFSPPSNPSSPPAMSLSRASNIHSTIL